MGSSIKHTDLSWELPGPRADMDLPLEGIERHQASGPTTGPWPEWGPGPWDENAEWPDD
jgi:hypothetical protein